MKKIVSLFHCFLVSLFLLFLFASPVQAQNKLGINIAARYWEFEDAANLVGPGGWVVVMASPGDASELNKMFSTHPEVNIVLRAHCPTDPLGPNHEINREFALTWAATLGGIDTAGRKIYVMPWNEPNMTRECGGLGNDFDPNNTACAPYVVEYVNNLKNYFDEAGILGKKAELISPMINQHHANYTAFINALGGRSFFEQFAGVTMNLYHHEGCGEDYCDAGRYHEVLSRVGLDGLKVFAAEMGIIAPSGSCPAGVSDCPVFEDSKMRALIESKYPIWKNDPNFVMFSPLSYNPEINAESWIWGSSTAAFYNAQPKGGHVPSSAGSDLNAFLSWRGNQPVSECPEGMEGAFAPEPLSRYCVKCGAAIAETHFAPIGYLDQMNITAETEIPPCQPEEAWYWAECYNPSEQAWDMDCLEALNKMGFSSDAFLCYPLWLKQWRDYILRVLPRFTPYNRLDEVVEHARELINSPAQGWVEFVTSGENHETKRTKITNPRILFGARFVRELSFATDFIWGNLTPLQQQRQKPILVRDGRDSHPGWESPCNDSVDFGAYWPPPGLFAADKIKGSCYPDKWCGGDCEDKENVCSKYCYRWKFNEETGEWYQDWHIEKDERWAMRQINPEIPTHDTIETLNPGWPELANTWSNLANPINGFIPAIAVAHNLPVKREGFCDDLFGDPEDLKDFDLAFSSGVDPAAKPSLCSWRYANTPFAYLYGPEGKMKAHGCAEYIDPETPEESKGEKQCFAHWPFVGGLRRVYEFIADWTNVYKKYHLEP